MINSIINELNGKNVCILGFGTEGKSTYHFIRRYSDMKLTIRDKKDVIEANSYLSDDNNIEVICGEDYLKGLEEYDLVIKGPGVITKDIDVSNIHFTSQLELLLKYDRKNVIGITTTKGKSTTSTLTYEVIKSCNEDTLLLGNIGTAIFDEIESIKDDTLLVVEMSALQLEFVEHSPHIAAILNLYEDHLDHAGTIEHYHQDKLNIFKYQTKDDYLLYSKDIEPLNSYIDEKYKANKYGISLIRNEEKNITSVIGEYATLNGEKLYNVNDKRLLIGDHNLRNIMFVLTIAKILNLDIAKVVKTINRVCW